jgi:hypothetical protein
MNSFSPAETLDIVASAIAAFGAPVPDCGSCCDWDCCGALGWSCAESRTTGRTRSPTNAQVASRVVMNRSIRCQHEKTNADVCRPRRRIESSNQAGSAWNKSGAVSDLTSLGRRRSAKSYNKGRRSRVRNVELMIPPMTTVASGR